MTTATKTGVNLPTLNQPDLARDSVKTVILASMIGTAIEFFDFYAYGTAAATYFPKVFFPEVTTTIATLLSLLTFGVAFVARPLGSFIFGHFGDKVGRKKNISCLTTAHGWFNRANWSTAGLPYSWNTCRHLALCLPIHSGNWAWRRVVRCRTCRYRKRPRRQTSILWSFS